MKTITLPNQVFEHTDILKQLAMTCSHITVWSNLDSPALALLKGLPDRLVCKVNETDKPWLNQHTELSLTEIIPLLPDDFYSIKTDFLYTAISNSYSEAKQVLNNCNNIRRFIAFQHTGPFMIRGSDRLAGLSNAFHEFKEEYPEWKPVYSSPKNWGLLILSKIPYYHNPAIKWNPVKYDQASLDRTEAERKEKLQKNRQWTIRQQANNHWDAIHKYPIVVPTWSPLDAYNWYIAWKAHIPSLNCDCKKNWEKLTEKYPPDFSSRIAFFKWTIDRHNDVNLELSKPHFSYSQAEALYGLSPI